MIPPFDELVASAERRLRAAGVSSISWQNLAASRQYLPLYNELLKVRGSDDGVPKRLLDWGAGQGVQMGFAADLGFDVSGAEFYEPPLVPGLRDEYGDLVTFRLFDDPRRLPFDDASFDVVLSMGVLEHVRETGGTEAASLAEIERVLRPGGTFICLHFPQHASWIEFLARTLPVDVHKHQFRYRTSDIPKMISKTTGLQLERQWRYGFFPRNYAGRLLGKRSGTPSVVDTFDRVDATVSRLLPGICTNHGFTARRVAT